MAAKTETEETWRETFKSYRLQALYAKGQVKKHYHLLTTQHTPGNLVSVVDKWRDQEFDVYKAIELHLKRGRRWGYIDYTRFTEEAQKAYDGYLETLPQEALDKLEQLRKL